MYIFYIELELEVHFYTELEPEVHIFIELYYVHTELARPQLGL